MTAFEAMTAVNKRVVPGGGTTGEHNSRPLFEPKHCRRCRVLHLDPRLRRPRSVGVPSVFRDDALEPQLAGVREDRRSIAVDVLVELDARVGAFAHEVLVTVTVRAVTFASTWRPRRVSALGWLSGSKRTRFPH